MPEPTVDHAPILKKMSEEILKASPKASHFVWHVLDGQERSMGGHTTPQVYITAVHDAAGNWISGESLKTPENRIVAKYQDELGWTSREDGLAFAFSVTEAKEITDLEGTGTLDPEFEGRPGLEIFY
jgi:hypothetical protein